MAPSDSIPAPPLRRRHCRMPLRSSPARSREAAGRERPPPIRSPASAPRMSRRFSEQAPEQSLMSEAHAYLRDGAAIYERSFAIIRAEADLAAFSPQEADIVVRMIHACGLVEAARHIVFGGALVGAA